MSAPRLSPQEEAHLRRVYASLPPTRETVDVMQLLATLDHVRAECDKWKTGHAHLAMAIVDLAMDIGAARLARAEREVKP